MRTMSKAKPDFARMEAVIKGETHDFSRDIRQPVTLARFNPQATRLLVSTGEISGGAGVDSVGCSLNVTLRVGDPAGLFHAEQDFGHHLAMVYGDQVRKLQALSEVMDFDILEV